MASKKAAQPTTALPWELLAGQMACVEHDRLAEARLDFRVEAEAGVLAAFRAEAEQAPRVEWQRALRDSAAKGPAFARYQKLRRQVGQLEKDAALHGARISEQEAKRARLVAEAPDSLPEDLLEIEGALGQLRAARDSTEAKLTAMKAPFYEAWLQAERELLACAEATAKEIHAGATADLRQRRLDLADTVREHLTLIYRAERTESASRYLFRGTARETLSELLGPRPEAPPATATPVEPVPPVMPGFHRHRPWQRMDGAPSMEHSIELNGAIIPVGQQA